MNEEKLIKRSIKSFCKKHNIEIGNNVLFKGDLCIYEIGLSDDSIYNEKTLAFLDGFDCACEVL